MDFPQTEYEQRTAAAQRLMHAAGFDAILLTTEADVRYFSGFRTLFWESPTRPWFLIVPRQGKPIAVIPEIGAALMRQTWLDDIRTWPSPHPDGEGVSLLAGALSNCSVIGLPMGRESQLRMPLSDYQALRDQIGSVTFYDAGPLLQSLRMIKSDREINVLRRICGIGSAAFAEAGRLFHAEQALSDAFRAFKIELLKQGAEDVPYLVGGAGPDGYADVISPPSDQPLNIGDVLMLDTGATLQGYFCDFDRNFAIGQASDLARHAYRTLWQATEAGIAAARPGVSAQSVFDAMANIVSQESSDVGRFGHGLGMQLTEPPSLIAWDQTILREGMVITLEPSMEVVPGSIMVHEENIVIRDGTPELLSQRAPPELPVL